MNTKTQEVLKALRDNAESDCFYQPENEHWMCVYLDNAKADLKMSAHEFAGYLSALTERGLYQAYDDGENNGFFGNVRMN